MKLQLNTLGEFMRGNSIDNMLSLISEFTDDKGVAKPNMAFKDLKNMIDGDKISYITAWMRKGNTEGIEDLMSLLS